MRLITESDKGGTALTATVDWAKAIKARDLTHPEATYRQSHGTPPFPGGKRHGTTLVISGLHHQWSDDAFKPLAREIWNLHPPLRTLPGRGQRVGLSNSPLWSALDPLRWTSSERWIRCPAWRKTRPAGDPGGSSVKSSSVSSGSSPRRPLKRGSHTSIPQLRAAILAYVNAHNDRGTPFNWIKTADEILDNMRRFGRRVQQVHGQ